MEESSNNNLVYVCIDCGDGDVMGGVYRDKAKAEQAVRDLQPTYYVRVEESQLED